MLRYFIKIFNNLMKYNKHNIEVMPLYRLMVKKGYYVQEKLFSVDYFSLVSKDYLHQILFKSVERKWNGTLDFINYIISLFLIFYIIELVCRVMKSNISTRFSNQFVFQSSSLNWWKTTTIFFYILKLLLPYYTLTYNGKAYCMEEEVH